MLRSSPNHRIKTAKAPVWITPPALARKGCGIAGGPNSHAWLRSLAQAAKNPRGQYPEERCAQGRERVDIHTGHARFLQRREWRGCLHRVGDEFVDMRSMPEADHFPS